MKRMILVLALAGSLGLLNAQTVPELPTIPVPEKVFTKDEMAQFKDAGKSIGEFISDNIQYPKELLKKGETAVVKVYFVVDSLGHLSKVYCEDSSSFKGNRILFVREAIRVIQKTEGKWLPAKRNGVSVLSLMLIPIYFEIEEE
jgi:outer membrane biosynthesis protein TonB